jgi:hypothetical protein
VPVAVVANLNAARAIPVSRLSRQRRSASQPTRSVRHRRDMRDESRLDPETRRLAEDAARKRNWKRWGSYLAERQWGTVREDYSPDGTSWDYFPHDHARSRAYRWGEDGLLGITDREGRLCFALALWNGNAPILKERLFGLTGPEGNHGEDVKECYFYLDATPTHSYLKALRVGLLGREPARARVVGVARLQDDGAARWPRSRLPLALPGMDDARHPLLRGRCAGSLVMSGDLATWRRYDDGAWPAIDPR